MVLAHTQPPARSRLLCDVEHQGHLDLALFAADLAASPPRPLLEPFLQIGGEVFKPAQRSDIDLHMLAMFFHDRQIEQNFVERVRTIHFGDSHHTPRAHTFPDVDDHAPSLRPELLRLREPRWRRTPFATWMPDTRCGNRRYITFDVPRFV